MKLEEVSRPE